MIHTNTNTNTYMSLTYHVSFCVPVPVYTVVQFKLTIISKNEPATHNPQQSNTRKEEGDLAGLGRNLD